MATFSPLDAARGHSLPWLGGGFNCYESFSGHPAPYVPYLKKATKKSKASGGPAGLGLRQPYG